MGSLPPTLTTSSSNIQKNTLMKMHSSFHTLHSPREQHHAPLRYICKKWSFPSLGLAQAKYNELKVKQNTNQQYVVAVLDVELAKHAKDNSYEVKAKIEFSDTSLKSEV
jgi:hypothetical protein